MTEGDNAWGGLGESAEEAAEALAETEAEKPSGESIFADYIRMVVDAGKVKQLAQDGGFGVNEATGRALIQSAEKFLQRWQGLKHKMELLKTGVPLGPDPYAQRITAFTAQQATDAYEKMETFEATCQRFVEGLEIAIKNYKTMDDEAAQQFRLDDYR